MQWWVWVLIGLGVVGWVLVIWFLVWLSRVELWR